MYYIFCILYILCILYFIYFVLFGGNTIQVVMYVLHIFFYKYFLIAVVLSRQPTPVHQPEDSLFENPAGCRDYYCVLLKRTSHAGPLIEYIPIYQVCSYFIQFIQIYTTGLTTLVQGHKLNSTYLIVSQCTHLSTMDKHICKHPSILASLSEISLLLLFLYNSKDI